MRRLEFACVRCDEKLLIVSVARLFVCGRAGVSERCAQKVDDVNITYMPLWKHLCAQPSVCVYMCAFGWRCFWQYAGH